MKTYNNYTLITENNINDVFDNMFKECKPFLNEWNNVMSHYLTEHNEEIFLTRGERHIEKQIELRTRNKDRKPTDTPEEIHNYLNGKFMEKFDEKLRNSVFCIKELNGSGYGKNYIVIPKGEYKMFWNKKIHDLFYDIKQVYDISLRTIMWDEKYFETNTEKFERLIHDYNRVKLNEIFDHDRRLEISLICDEYYLIDYNLKSKLIDKIYEL